MHVLFVERHDLEETEIPTDLDQSAADLVVLSFSDSDLGAFAEGWHRYIAQGDNFPTLRLANLAALKHPVSVDTYIEKTLSAAKGILIRLIVAHRTGLMVYSRLKSWLAKTRLLLLLYRQTGVMIRSWMRCPPCLFRHCAGCSIYVKMAAWWQPRQRWLS